MHLPKHPSLPALEHRWKLCVGQGRAAELLRADCLEHLARAQRDIGFRYLRFHGLFHDEMNVVSRRADGSLCFQWRMIDQVFDAMLAMGLRPFVELNAMPQALASGEQSIFQWKLNVTPPRDPEEWSELVLAFTRHCVTRWGLPEVKQWYFEVWNEPNLAGFWSGTQEEYFDLYRRAALAVKSVHPDLRMGGPATAQGRWIPELIRFCGDSATPLDFVSTHSYQQDERCFYPDRCQSPHAPGDYLLDQFRRVHDEVQTSARPDLEIHWTEWNSLTASPDGKVSWTDSPSTDALYAGSFALQHVTRSEDLCDSLSWWIVTDIFGEHGMSPLPFSHTYGLLTGHGIPKASFHAFKWLGRMTGERYAVAGAPADPRKGLLATREACGTLRILCWYHPAMEEIEGAWQDEITLDLPCDTLLTRSQLQQGQGSAYEAWQAWGCPPNLTPTQREALETLACPAVQVERLPAGPQTLRFSLQPHEVLFLEAAPAEAPAENRGIYKETQPAALETQLAAKTK